MKKAVFGIAQDERIATRIVNDLKAEGFHADDISALLPDRQGSRDFAHEQHTKMPEGATVGAGSGAVAGAALGWLVGVGTLAIPGLGPFIAAGPIMAALAGAGAGAASGGIIGALVGLGIPELEAKQYEGKVRNGNILISIHTENSDERGRAKDLLKRDGAVDVSDTSEATPPR
jgi:hypothetical protein